MEFYDFQELDLGYLSDVLQEHGGAYLAWDRGLGKTLGALAVADELDCKRVLVVAPNTAKATVWEPHVRQFLPHHKCLVMPNSKPKREKLLAWLKLEKDPICMIVHYEALNIIANMRSGGRGWDAYGEWDLVIADEAHRIKNPKAKMSRGLKKVPAKYKLALSGSIIQNHADELFSVLQWLFPERYKSKWRDWNDRFLDFVDSGYASVPVGVKIERIKEMRAELGVFTTYRRKDDELDLPKRTDQNMYVKLSKGQRKVYDDMVAFCMAELPEGSLTKWIKSPDGIAMLGKLRQIATGLDLVDKTLKDSTKLDLAIDLIQDTPDDQTVLFSWYKASGRAAFERLNDAGIPSLIVDGDVPQEVRAERIKFFQEGKCKVLIGTISTMGESVNLQNANNAIFLDRSWNPAQNVQAEDRIYRLGQEKPVTITHIIAEDTVDESRVLPVIENKEALRKLILGG